MKTFEYNNTELRLHVGNYQANSIAMALTATDLEGSPYAVFSVNLGTDIGNGSYVQHGCTFLDTNNCPGIGEALESAGLAEKYTRFGSSVEKQSGFCSYPLYEFNLDNLAEYVPQSEIDAYTNTWSAGINNLQARESRVERAENLFGHSYSDFDIYGYDDHDDYDASDDMF